MGARWHEVKAAMRSAPVVVRDVLGKDSLKVMPRDDEQVIEAVLSDGAHPSLGEGVRVRGADRGEDALGVDRGEDLVEAGGEFGIAVTDEEAHPLAGLLERGTEVAGDLGHPRAVGVGRDAEEVDDAPFHFDHEQYVVAAEQHGIDGEEVGSEDARGLSAEELGPGGTSSPWRWWKPMAAQDIGDAALGDGDPEFFSSPAMRR